tara:strand:+ start:32 stop:877 length:846 start_codon:yes stop_codon:yes gene_type:complete
MTGYGEAEAFTSRGKLSVQLKSLNSKNFELNFRANSSFQQFELDAKKQLLKKLKRGKIELFVVEDSTNIAAHKINRAVVAEYMKQLKSISAAPDEILFPLTLRMPDALKNLNKKTTSSQIKELKKLLDKSIDKLILYRINEGKSIEKYLRNKILNIEKKLNKIEKGNQLRIKKRKSKLIEKLKKINIKIDKERLEQEVFYYIEKLDINEEINRLKHHTVFFKQELNNKDIVKGKKLGFISQEIAREINTVGSKANDVTLQKLVVQIKDLVEQIKEQVPNIL